MNEKITLDVIDFRPDWFQNLVSEDKIITHAEAFQVTENPFDVRNTYCEIKTKQGTIIGDYGSYIIKDESNSISVLSALEFEELYTKIDD